MAKVRGKILSMLLALTMALQLVGVGAVQAFAQEVDQMAASGLVYDEVYGVKHGEYALMDKYVETTTVNGEETEVHQVDLVDKDGNVSYSLTYDETTVSYDWNQLDRLCTSFGQSWNYVIVAENSNTIGQQGKYGILSLDGTMVTDYSYDYLWVPGAEDHYAIGVTVDAKGNARYDFFNSSAKLIESIDVGEVDMGSLPYRLDYFTQVGPYAVFWTSYTTKTNANGYEEKYPVYRVFEKDGDTYKLRSDIVNVRAVDDNYWLVNTGVGLILESKSSSVTLDITLGGTRLPQYWASWQGDVLKVMEWLDGEGYTATMYFDKNGNRVDEPTVDTDNRTVTVIGDTGRNLVETHVSYDKRTYTIETEDGQVICDLPSYVQSYNSLYSVCGEYVYQMRPESGKASVYDSSGNTVATIDAGSTEFIYVRNAGISGMYTMNDSQDDFVALLDSSFKLVSTDERYDNLRKCGTWVDGEIVYCYPIADDDSSYDEYAFCDENLQPLTFDSYTLSYSNSVISTGYYYLYNLYNPFNQYKRTNADIYYVSDASGKYGAIDSQGNVVIPFEYEGYYDAGNDDTSYILLKKDGAWLFYDTAPEPEPTPDTSEDAIVPRLAGAETAYQTSAIISKQAFPNGSDWVVLARDDDFADAMSTTGLAGALDAPIVLTDRFGLSTEAADEIKRLGATSCYIIGGTGAMPGDFESQLEALNVTTVERVYGSESWDTSVACADKIAKHNGNANHDAIVAMSLNFQDALSISSFAYKYAVPIYLQTAEGDRPLPQAAISAISELDGTIYVPGGTGAVRESTVEGTFSGRTIVRMFGETGYDTSNQIATYMVQNGKLSADTVCVACGAEKAKGSDALSGAALAGKLSAPMLLVNSNVLMEDANLAAIEGVDSRDTQAFLTANASSVERAYVLGGSFVVPNALRDTIYSMLA